MRAGRSTRVATSKRSATRAASTAGVDAGRGEEAQDEIAIPIITTVRCRA